MKGVRKKAAEINKNNELLEDIASAKEEKFIHLLVDIILSVTLKEAYEESNQIPTIQPTRTE